MNNNNNPHNSEFENNSSFSQFEPKTDFNNPSEKVEMSKFPNLEPKNFNNSLKNQELPLSPQEITSTVNALKTQNLPYDKIKEGKHAIALLQYLITREQFRGDFDTEGYFKIREILNGIVDLYRISFFGSLGVSFLYFRHLRVNSKLYGLTYTPWMLGSLAKYFLIPLFFTRLVLSQKLKITFKDVDEIMGGYDLDKVQYRILYNREIFARGENLKMGDSGSKQNVEEEFRLEEKYPGYENWRQQLDESLANFNENKKIDRE